MLKGVAVLRNNTNTSACLYAINLTRENFQLQTKLQLSSKLEFTR